MGSRAVVFFFFFLALLSFSASADNGEEEDVGLIMNFYRDSCPQAEDVIREQVRLLYKRHKNTAFSWLRNLFHDCAVQVYMHNVKPPSGFFFFFFFFLIFSFSLYADSGGGIVM